MMAATLAADWGPFAPGLDHAEALARTRSLRALVNAFAGPHGRACAAALRDAETDPVALHRAADLLDRLPTIPRRHVLAAYAGLIAPDRRASA